MKCRERLQRLGCVQVLETLDGWVDAIPAVTQSLRYGNPAFRTWHARAAAHAPRLLAAVLPPQLAGASQELGLYLSDSLGIAHPHAFPSSVTLPLKPPPGPWLPEDMSQSKRALHQNLLCASLRETLPPHVHQFAEMSLPGPGSLQFCLGRLALSPPPQ